MEGNSHSEMRGTMKFVVSFMLGGYNSASVGSRFIFLRKTMNRTLIGLIALLLPLCASAQDTSKLISMGAALQQQGDMVCAGPGGYGARIPAGAQYYSLTPGADLIPQWQANTFVASELRLQDLGGVIRGAGAIQIVPASGSNVDVLMSNGSASSFRVRDSVNGNQFFIGTNGNIAAARTVAGAAGNVTQNTPTGRVTIAAAAASLTLTNSLITANSFVFCTVVSNDTTAKSCSVQPASGSATVRVNANTTANTDVIYWVIN